MILLTNISATATDGRDLPQRMAQSASVEVLPGWFMRLRVSRDGLQMERGSQVISIPLSELAKIAAKAHPSFRPTMKGKGAK
jgi:hypothetical protein